MLIPLFSYALKGIALCRKILIAAKSACHAALPHIKIHRRKAIP